jgi:hypothetical protein
MSINVTSNDKILQFSAKILFISTYPWLNWIKSMLKKLTKTQSGGTALDSYNFVDRDLKWTGLWSLAVSSVNM